MQARTQSLQATVYTRTIALHHWMVMVGPYHRACQHQNNAWLGESWAEDSKDIS